jgi:hypothetical protein
MAVDACPLAMLCVPRAVERSPLAVVFAPNAVETNPLAFVFDPIATEFSPMLTLSHKSPLTSPARNARSFGDHRKRTPAPLIPTPPVSPVDRIEPPDCRSPPLNSSAVLVLLDDLNSAPAPLPLLRRLNSGPALLTVALYGSVRPADAGAHCVPFHISACPLVGAVTETALP